MSRALLTLIFLMTEIASAKAMYDLGSASNLKNNRLMLEGNRSIQMKRIPGRELRVIFEDKFPRANWGHPATVKLVDELGTVFDEQTVTSPPKGWQKIQKQASDDLFKPPSKATIKLVADTKWRVKDPTKHFALLINGNASQRHWNDYAFLYKTLTEVYGYQRSHIFVADSFHKTELPDLDDDGKPDIDYESTIGGIRGLIQQLATTLSSDSELLIVVNDHGEIKDGQPVLVVNDGDINAKDFNQWIHTLPPKRAISVFQQCFGGGFVRGAIGEFRVALSASSNQEFSWATKDMQFDEFLYHFTSGLAGQTADGKPVLVDNNRDGRVSVQEAFAYALNNDSTPENPLLESYPNSGFAQLFGIHF